MTDLTISPLHERGYIYRRLSTADTNAEVVRAESCTLTGFLCINTTATLYYLKVYNSAAAADENDTPILTIPVPANAAGAGFAISLPRDIFFDAGIAIRLTSGIADADTGSAATGVVIHVFWK